MSMISIIQSVCLRIGVPSPNAVATSQDTQYLQLLALLNEAASSLCTKPWQSLRRQATFNTVAAEIQGSVATICPGMSYITNDTIWNRTLRRPVFGPLSAQDWQWQKAIFSAGPWSQFRVFQNNINFFPIPSAGQECDFEYTSNYYATDSTGVTYQSSFLADADLSVLDEELLALGTIWLWKANKGLDFGTDYQKFDNRMTNLIGRDGSKPILNMSGDKVGIAPAIMVAAGSWMV